MDKAETANFPLPKMQEWGEGKGEGKSNKHGPPLTGPLLPRGKRGEHPPPDLFVVSPQIHKESVTFACDSRSTEVSGQYGYDASMSELWQTAGSQRAEGTLPGMPAEGGLSHRH